MKKAEKVFLVDNLAARIRDGKSLVFVNLMGLKMAQQDHLRRRLGEAGASLTVVKNTLLGRALRSGLGRGDLALQLGQRLEGQTAVVIAGDDELAPLQQLGKFLREFEQLQLKFGLIFGNLEEAERLLAISKLPARQVLLGQVIGSLAGPLYILVATLQGNLQKLVYILKQNKLTMEGRS